MRIEMKVTKAQLTPTKSVLGSTQRKLNITTFVLMIAWITCSNFGISQNLVGNPSFETYTSFCPSGNGKINDLDNWRRMPSHGGSVDVLHDCSTNINSRIPNNSKMGWQFPNTGDGYIGFVVYSQTSTFREYAENTFVSPMVAGQEYCVSFYVNLSDKSPIYSDNAIQIHFSSTQLSGGGNTNFGVSATVPTFHYQQSTPIDDKSGWVLQTFNYIATGGEQYMYIGNFLDDASTNIFNHTGGNGTTIFYAIDDMSVTPVVDATIAPAAPLCIGDPSTNLSAVSSGGTWSGTGITDVNAGTFDPATAGVGTHTITYSIAGPCGDTQTEDIVVSNCALPIELLEFNAEAVNERKVALTWTTVNEINNDYFEIERSRDGTTFNTIETIDGAGNSSITLHYNDFDEDPYNGVSYYRLKQTDFDGTYTYSDIRTVVFDDLSFVNMYPNPAEEELQFTVMVSEDADLYVQIVDVMGRVITLEDYAVLAGESTITLDVSNFASGMYTIRVNTNDENHLSKEFIRR